MKVLPNTYRRIKKYKSRNSQQFFVFFYLPLVAALISCSTDARRATSSSKLPPLCGQGSMINVTTLSLDTLPPPIFREALGKSHPPINTRSIEAQKWFDQGLNLLHDFWHIEAYRAFRQVIRLDSTCAMGYWGVFEKALASAQQYANLTLSQQAPIDGLVVNASLRGAHPAGVGIYVFSGVEQRV